MTVKITEVTKEDRATFGMRMQRIREGLGLTRNNVSEQTGIPVRTIEKFEQGTMSPNVERLQALARVLTVSVGHLLDGVDETEQPAHAVNSNAVLPSPGSSEEHSEDVTVYLVRLDAMRAEGFQRYWRKAPRLIDEAETLLSRMQYDELLDIAEERGVMAISQEEIDGFIYLEPDEQVDQVHELSERILDTAYFGVDLYKIEMSYLEGMAEQFGLRSDKSGSFFFEEWSSDAVLVKALRVLLRHQFLAGDTLKLLDDKLFPKRGAA